MKIGSKVTGNYRETLLIILTYLILNRVTIHLFRLEQCCKQQLKKHHIILHFVPDSPLLPDIMRRRDGHTKNQILQSGRSRTNSETRREDLLRKAATNSESGRSRLWQDKLGEGTRPCFSPFPGCLLLRSAVAWQQVREFFGNLRRFSAIPPPRPQPSVPSGSREPGLVLCVCCPSKCHTGRCLRRLGNVW